MTAGPGGPLELLASREAGGTCYLVGAGALAVAAGRFERWLTGRAVACLVSPGVERLHGARLDPLLGAAARRLDLRAPDGEPGKQGQVLLGLWEEMAAAGLRRDSRLVVLGGGALTDLGGVLAAGWMRGIEMSLLPTTLVGQIDAAVGGKAAIDLPQAKNQVGAFHPARLVVADPLFLATQPPAAWQDGAVELLKIAVATDPALFEAVAAVWPRLLDADGQALEPLLGPAVAAKLRIVDRDPRDRGERAVLNLGHSLGHALEAAAGYGVISHGRAVAHGMAFAVLLAAETGGCPAAPALGALLEPLLAPPLPPLPAATVLAALGRDKKAGEEGLSWVLPRAIGRAETGVRVPRAVVARLLPAYLEAAARGAAGRIHS